MAEAGDIVRISIPFTAGVAAAAMVPEGHLRGHVAAGVCAATGIAMLLFCGKGRRKAASTALFFCLGALGLLSHEIAFDGGRIPPQWLSTAMERLCSLIDSIGFEDPRTPALVKALLTGHRESLSPTEVQLFRESGASHILALSGLHLGVLYGILDRMLSILGNSRTAGILRSLTAISATAFYTVFTGAPASIVRAFLFITVNEALRHCPGRRRDPLGVLCSALMIQLSIRPEVISSLGFQLSYLAMLGIYTLYPRLERWYPESVSFDIARKIWKSAALSVSCQAFTAPLVWLRFRTFPLFFLMTNLIAMPLAELLMLSSVGCVICGLAGCCPDIMKSPVDFLARTLLFCLETISTMQGFRAHT